MTEFELIEKLTANLPGNDSVVIGTGDDCAALEMGKADELVLFKTDAVVEGVHFKAETEPEKIGHKALGRVLSDIGAMGGVPGAALVTLGLAEGFDAARVEAIYRGMNQLAARYRVAIVGGETVRVPQGMMISIAMIGHVNRDRCVQRSGARPGDGIFVSGELGGSLAGRHLEFEPRVREGQWLATHFDIHSMIDLSDGLASDLRHLLKPDQLGAELLAASIPISRAAKMVARSESSGKPALLAGLTDGEDFELLFTVASKDAVPVLDGWKKEFPEVPLTCIGKVREESGVLLRDKDGVRQLNVHGYTHFQ